MTNPVMPHDDRGNPLQPFQKTGNTVVIAATVASASVAIAPGDGSAVRVFNAGTTPAAISFTGVAAATDIVVGPGLSTLYLPDGVTAVAAIMLSGTANIYFTPGKGA